MTEGSEKITEEIEVPATDKPVPPLRTPLRRKKSWLDRKNPYYFSSQRLLRNAIAWSLFGGFVCFEIIFVLYIARKLL